MAIKILLDTGGGGLAFQIASSDLFPAGVQSKVKSVRLGKTLSFVKFVNLWLELARVTAFVFICSGDICTYQEYLGNKMET